MSYRSLSSLHHIDKTHGGTDVNLMLTPLMAINKMSRLDFVNSSNNIHIYMSLFFQITQSAGLHTRTYEINNLQI